ncbi:MAG: hypothetical protein MJ133_06365 [Lachnospiraceae bacterium]|nr:hypothetical protein [Lachnospiraceae bacterium]
MSKEEWKESGKKLGKAWANFGKTFIRSAETTGEKVSEWADGQEPNATNAEPNSTVYSDGSWKQVGKDLGGAFAGVGKSLLHTMGIADNSNIQNDYNQDSNNPDYNAQNDNQNCYTQNTTTEEDNKI